MYAFMSIFDKDGIVPLAQFLDEKGWYIIASDGTAEHVHKKNGVRCRSIEYFTGYPHMFGGRVKGFHPKIFGGILARKQDAKEAHKHHIFLIDLVVVNFYPFMQVVQSGASAEECIENIDIGGPAYVRAAAKNFERVTVLVDPKDYELVMNELRKNKDTSLETREKLAYKAWRYVEEYDVAITHWWKARFAKPIPNS